MLLLIGSFIAGMLTVLAPCILALLPVIIGGSVSGDTKDRKRPFIIVASLAISLLAFTLLLKTSTLFINVPDRTFAYVSGVIIVGLGLLMLLPTLYARVIAKLGIEQRAVGTLSKTYKNQRPYIGPIVIGASLGPVFASCSPVYAYILATVLPVNFAQALLYIVAFIVGLVAVLLPIGIYGQRFVSKIKFASNPKGWFQRTIAVLFILVGVLLFTGYDKSLQTWISQNTPFDIDGISRRFIPESRETTKDLFNVESYDAPEYVGLENWINSDPLSIEKQRGKVVMVDFWTYSCINCIRNNPYLITLYEKYKDKGFEIVGVHAPEFAFEKNPANVEKAVRDQNIPYPVALDNSFKTWAAYQNRSWPAYYLVDATGKVRKVHEGEGEYEKTEQAIRELLIENGVNLDGITPAFTNTELPVSSRQTPETYLGAVRASNFQNAKPLAAKSIETFVPASDLKADFWTLGGTWEVRDKMITARGNSTLRFHVSAKEVYLVMGSNTPQNVMVQINGQPISMEGVAGSDVKQSKVTVSEFKLYRLVDFREFRGDRILELTVPDGVELNAFTFGS